MDTAIRAGGLNRTENVPGSFDPEVGNFRQTRAAEERWEEPGHHLFEAIYLRLIYHAELEGPNG